MLMTRDASDMNIALTNHDGHLMSLLFYIRSYLRKDHFVNVVYFRWKIHLPVSLNMLYGNIPEIPLDIRRQWIVKFLKKNNFNIRKLHTSNIFIWLIKNLIAIFHVNSRMQTRNVKYLPHSEQHLCLISF